MSKKAFIISLFVFFFLAGDVFGQWWLLEYRLDWVGVTDDWYDSNNWSANYALLDPFPPYNWPGEPNIPDANIWAAVHAAPYGPNITSDVTTILLSVIPWVGGTQTVTIHSGLINCGLSLAIAHINPDTASGQPDDFVGTGIVNMFGGAVIAPRGSISVFGTWDIGGVAVGGGRDRTGSPVGILNMYGGTITVPSVDISNGVVNLYGGKITCITDSQDAFDIYMRPTNDGLNIAGGTFSMAGDHTDSDGKYMVFIADERINGYGFRGEVSYDFNGTYTNFTAEPNYGRAWRPEPRNLSTAIELNPTLSWNPGEWAQDINGHGVYFSTDESLVNSRDAAAYIGRQDANSYAPEGPLVDGKLYYWAIDEYNDVNGTSPWHGHTWEFRTFNTKAVDPNPEDGAVGLRIDDLNLYWVKGVWAGSSNGHEIYFGTDFDDVNDATTASGKPVYRGKTTNPTYLLSRLLEAPGYTLEYDTTYYWRIDEVNIINPQKRWKGDVWQFRIPKYFIVEDFERYADTEEMSENWKTDPGAPCSDNGSSATISLDADKGNMELIYQNDGNGPGDYFSEAGLAYAAGKSWTTAGGLIAEAPLALSITFTGDTGNDTDPVYDRMYAVIEDADGDTGTVIYNPDPDAQAIPPTYTQQWEILLSDMNSPDVDLSDITNLYIGFGERCNVADPCGGEGAVIIDDIRLYTSHCVPEKVKPQADFDNDCIVGLEDVDIMSEEWLTEGVFADLYDDDNVDFTDFAILADSWLEEQLWP